MVLLLPLLYVAGRLVTALTLPQETTTSGTVASRTPDIDDNFDPPAFELQQLCKTPLNDPSSRTELCNFDNLLDDNKLANTETSSPELTVTDTGLGLVEKRVNGEHLLKDDDRCFFAQISKLTPDKHLVWEPTDDQFTEGYDCKKYCASHSDRTADQIKSDTCFKNDKLPWIDQFGQEPSVDSPIGTTIYGRGKCVCDWKLLDDLVGGLVREALPAIGEITCKTFYTAINTVVATGLNAIPGLGVVEAAGVGLAAQAAQVMAWTFSNQTEAMLHYQDWLQNPSGEGSPPVDAEVKEPPAADLMDKICGNRYMSTDADDIFDKFQFAASFAFAPRLFTGATRSWPPPFAQNEGNLQNALDYIKDFYKGKAKPTPPPPKLTPPPPKPTPPPPKPAPPTPKPTPPTPKPTQRKPLNKPSDKPTNKPTSKSNDKPTTTTSHAETNKAQSTKSDEHKQCKRADGACVTNYSVEKMIANPKATTLPHTCDHKAFPQACAHYYSAINERGLLAEFTCSASNGRQNGRATAHWKAQHANEQWQSFTRRVKDDKGDVVDPHCEADEYPPGYFLDDGRKMTQLIRWMPKFDNGGAGRLWKQFCINHDGDAGNGQRIRRRAKPGQPKPAEESLEFNEDLMKLEGLYSRQGKGKDGQTTVTSIWKKATFTRAVFSLTFSYNKQDVPSRNNCYYLKANGCWPKAITPNDPGYVLLTDDKWYDENPEAQANRKRYALEPSQKEIDTAKRDHKEIFKRGLHNMSEEYPPDRSPTPNLPHLKEAEKFELYEGSLYVRDVETNATRPLAEDEIRHQVEIISCKDKHCSAELQGHDIGDHALLIPAVPPPSLPSSNENAVPTFTPTPSMRTEIRPLKRTNVSPDVPVVTN